MMKLAVYRNRKELAEVQKQLESDYKAGNLAGMSFNAIADKYTINAMTAKKWITKIKAPAPAQPIGKGFKTLVVEVPKDWQWLKLRVSDNLKEKFDKLTTNQKVTLYKLVDSEIKLLDQDNIDGGPISLFNPEGKMTKFITIKVSPEAIARWQEIPTIREGNAFSRTSWAVNNVILPFLNMLK
jgi:predicted DNA-binding protein (MmcQ/YjbR family)